MKKSRGQMLWGKARDVAMDAVDPDRNPDSNTFRPSGAVTEEDAREALIRKRDPLRGKKMKLLAYTVLLLVFLATSMGARPTLDIYSQNSVLENLMMMRVDEESGMKQQELGIAWSFITTEVCLDARRQLPRLLARPPACSGRREPPGTRILWILTELVAIGRRTFGSTFPRASPVACTVRS
jgi:hypothetical protein